jgi:hypothetical protein
MGAEAVTSGGDGGVGEARRSRTSSSEASSLSSTSAASLLAVIHAEDFQRNFNLLRRPFQRSGVAFYGGFEASGAVPASEFDGGISGLLLTGGDREGPDCILRFSAEVLSAYTRDPYVIVEFMGSFVTYCTPTAWLY